MGHSPSPSLTSPPSSRVYISVGGVDCGPAVAAWLTDVLGKECRLVRQTQQRRAKKLSLTTGDATVTSSSR